MATTISQLSILDCGDFAKIDVKIDFWFIGQWSEPERMDEGTLDESVSLYPPAPHSGALVLSYVSDRTHTCNCYQPLGASLGVQFAGRVQDGHGVERLAADPACVIGRGGEDIAVPKRVVALLGLGYPVLVGPGIR